MNFATHSVHHDVVVPSGLTFEKNEFRALVVLIALVMLVKFFITRVFTGEVVLPGVPEFKGLPILGTIPVYLSRGTPEVLKRLINTGNSGIAYANLMGSSVISVHDPVMTKEVLLLPEEVASRQGDPDSFRWSPFSTLQRLIGDNLFSYTGPETNQQRNWFIREFQNTKSNAEKFDAVKRVAQWHVQSLAPEQEADIDDIGHSANYYAISMWGEVLYGNFDYYKEDKVLSLSESIIAIASSPWSSIWYAVQLSLGIVSAGEPTGMERNVRKGVDRVVEKSLRVMEECEAREPDAPLKVIRSLSVRSGGNRTGSLSKFAANFANLNFFGGHHSIGSLMTCAFVELDRHPRCLAKLMQEIDSIDSVDFTTINSRMPYLEAVVMEINRLYPVVHATLRIMHCDATLTSGQQPITLKRDMLLYVSFLHLQTSKDFWGPEADVFIPERFVGGHDKSNPLFAFGYGVRSCVGYKFALLAFKVYLVEFLKTYRFELKEHDHKMKTSTLIETDKPVAVRVTRRV